MIDMKISEKEQKEKYSAPVMHDAPKYPYGLCLCLDTASFEKLGIKMPKLGEKMKLEAVVEVTALSASSYKGEEKNINVSLQITEMELKPSAGKSAEEVIY